MNGIDRISQRILEDAQAEAARIIEEAEERARSIKDRKTKEVRKNNQKLHRIIWPKLRIESVGC